MLLNLLFMPPLISTNIIHPLPRLDQRITTGLDTTHATQIRCWTKRDLLLLRNIVIADLVDDQLAYRHKGSALVRHCGVFEHILGVGNMCLDSEDDGLLWEALVQINLKVVFCERMQLCRIVGVQVFAVRRVEAIADIRHLAVCIGQNMCVGLVVSDGAIVEGVRLGRLDEYSC